MVFFIWVDDFVVLPHLVVILDSSLSILFSPLAKTIFKFGPEAEHFYLPPPWSQLSLYCCSCFLSGSLLPSLPLDSFSQLSAQTDPFKTCLITLVKTFGWLLLKKDKGIAVADLYVWSCLLQDVSCTPFFCLRAFIKKALRPFITILFKIVHINCHFLASCTVFFCLYFSP